MGDKKFITKQTRNRHITSVHEGTKPFNCELCDLKFSENFRLKQYVLSVHEGIKPFKCDSLTRNLLLSKAVIDTLHQFMKAQNYGR